MSLSEFELIKKYFTKATTDADVVMGVGDDGAIVSPNPEYDLVISTDTLNETIHFPKNFKPFDLGYRSLAVSLSDLAAMGASPTWFLLSLTIPGAQDEWLQEFANGLFSLSNTFKMQLIGGNTTQGPLAITTQVFGYVPKKKALLRNMAKENDLIYVTNTLGDAALALKVLQGKIKMTSEEFDSIGSRFLRPEPRIKEGELLRDIANAAIDISDGLAADLNHILTQSSVGATLEAEKIPLSPILHRNLPEPEALTLVLQGGDDYELCFTVPEEKHSLLQKISNQFTQPPICIGRIEKKLGLRIKKSDGNSVLLDSQGYQHFR